MVRIRQRSGHSSARADRDASEPSEPTRSVPAGVAAGPAAEVLAVQRLAGNRAVQRLLAVRAGTIQRKGGKDDVTVEEVHDDEPPRSREPVPVPEPSGPLLLTDRPWAQIEQEREARWQPRIEEVPDDEPPRSREPVPVPEPSGPLLLADRPWAEIERDREQQRDPRWQNKIQELSRPSVGPWAWSGDERAEGGRSLPERMERRRARALKPTLAGQRTRQFDEAVVAGREKERLGTRPAAGFEATASALGSALEADRLAKTAREAEDAAAKPSVDAKNAAIAGKVRAAKQAAGEQNLNTDALNALDKRRGELQRAERWAPLSDILDQLNDEAAKLQSYVNALVKNGDRITKLDTKFTPQKTKVELRGTTYKAFFDEVTKKPRNDTRAVAALTTLEDAIRVEEDKVEAAAARSIAAQQQLAQRQQLRTQGLLPANGKPAAVITTVTRTTVGSAGEERAAVLEALDALNNPTNDHSWARKWGEYHGNGEGNLPGITGAGGYKEYYVRPDGALVGQVGRTRDGVRRLVMSNTTGFVYYSHNHYGAPNGTILPAFVRVTDA